MSAHDPKQTFSCAYSRSRRLVSLKCLPQSRAGDAPASAATSLVGAAPGAPCRVIKTHRLQVAPFAIRCLDRYKFREVPRLREEGEASAGGAYRTERGIDQGILAPLAIALTLLIGASVRCSARETHAALWDVRLTEFVAKAMEEASIPGAIIGIWQDGQFPYVRAFDVRDTATGEPMATDLHMRIGSVTKTFVTTAILQLVDQGKVGLDDPISKYVPGVPNGDAVTLRQLAGMRSGLFDYSDVTQTAMPDDPKRRYTPQDLLEIVVQHPPELPADTKFDYNNSNTVLLGLVVEKVSGQPLNRYIDEHIVQAEHLQHTVFPADATLPSPHAHGYTKTTEGKIVDATDWNSTGT